MVPGDYTHPSSVPPVALATAQFIEGAHTRSQRVGPKKANRLIKKEHRHSGRREVMFSIALSTMNLSSITAS